MAENETPSFHGHRERIKNKFSEAGLDAFADHEVLELLLCPLAAVIAIIAMKSIIKRRLKFNIIFTPIFYDLIIVYCQFNVIIYFNQLLSKYRLFVPVHKGADVHFCCLL